MVKETEETIGFVVIIFIIGGGGARPPGCAYGAERINSNASQMGVAARQSL